MSRLLFLLGLLALTQWVASDTSSKFTPLRPHVQPAKSRIIGGEEVAPNSVPYQAGLRINGNSFCGGALISPNYVLTAGHCGIVIRTVQVILGAHNISNPNEATQVTITGQNTILHEDYDDDTLRNDITLIQLAQPAPLNDNIQIVKLPPRSDVDQSYVDKIATATGWGLDHDVAFPTTRDMSDVLLTVDVAVTNLTDCGQYFNDDEAIYVTTTNICTSGYKNKGTCNGDSGGPLTLDGVLIGVTSFGTDECESCYPSVYTIVSAYLDWIAANSDVQV